MSNNFHIIYSTAIFIPIIKNYSSNKFLYDFSVQNLFYYEIKANYGTQLLLLIIMCLNLYICALYCNIVLDTFLQNPTVLVHTIVPHNHYSCAMLVYVL